MPRIHFFKGQMIRIRRIVNVGNGIHEVTQYDVAAILRAVIQYNSKPPGIIAIAGIMIHIIIE
jgi:hypothetical protein